MPATRTKETVSRVVVSKKPIAPALIALEPILNSLSSETSLETRRDFASIGDIHYPKGGLQRESYRTKAGKRVTAHHWAVYDLVRKIPVGKVSTYKDICSMLGEGSPRSVGTALRNNPFAPFVPCHRIVASNRSIGGFCGDWESSSSSRAKTKTKKTVSHCDWKIKMLALEGVEFDESGYLVAPGSVLWKDW